MTVPIFTSPGRSGFGDQGSERIHRVALGAGAPLRNHGDPRLRVDSHRRQAERTCNAHGQQLFFRHDCLLIEFDRYCTVMSALVRCAVAIRRHTFSQRR